MPDTQLSILIIDADADRSQVVEEGLVEAGYSKVITIHPTQNLQERVLAIDPDVIIIDLENPDRDTLEHMFQVTQEVRRPIAMFVDQSDSDSISRAIEAGVSAYVVDGLRKDRVSAVTDMAITRFRYFDKLRQERDDARSALAERKLIDRAKGILMEKRKLSEQEAYKLLRSTAMRNSKRMAEIANSIIVAAELDL